MVKTNFNEFEYLNGLGAIWSQKLNLIECEIEFGDLIIDSIGTLKLIKNIFEQKK